MSEESLVPSTPATPKDESGVELSTPARVWDGVTVCVVDKETTLADGDALARTLGLVESAADGDNDA